MKGERILSIIIFLIIGLLMPVINFTIRKKTHRYIYNYKFIFLCWIINLIVIYLFLNEFHLYEIDRNTIAIFVLFISMNILLDSSIVDIKYMEIPNTNNAIVFGLGVIYLLLIRPENVWLYVLSAVCLFITSFVMACVSTLGGGDIKLLTAIGLYVPINIGINVLFYSCVIALIYVVMKKIYSFFDKSKNNEIEKAEANLFPFGQFIVLSFFIILFVF